MTGREINLLGARTLPRQGGMSHLRDPIGLDDSLVVLPGQPPAIAAATSVAASASMDRLRGRCPTPSAMAGHLSTKMSDQLVVITCPFRRLHATARRRGRARRLIIAEGETCDAPVTAGRATTGSAIGATPLFQRGQANQREGLGRHGAVVSRRSEHGPREGGSMNRGEPPAPLIRPKGCPAIDPR